MSKNKILGTLRVIILIASPLVFADHENLRDYRRQFGENVSPRKFGPHGSILMNQYTEFAKNHPRTKPRDLGTFHDKRLMLEHAANGSTTGNGRFKRPYLAMRGPKIATTIKIRPPGVRNKPQLIRAEKLAKKSKFFNSPNRQKRMNWNDFQRFDVIEAWLDNVAASKPFAKTITIGKTWEKRNLKLIEINTKGAKDIFWIDGGIHAREWASPATVTHFVNELVNNYESNKELVDSFRWYILPVHNPDGYEYTHTTDRMWRKNRSRRTRNNRRNRNNRADCPGVDLNRNWNFHWGVGSSNKPCDETYRGAKAESEESIIAVRNFINNLSKTVPGGRLAAFYSVHSYGPYWLTPWGWTTQDAPNNARLVEVAKVGVDAIRRRYGTEYLIMKASQLGSPASGASDDWAYGVAKFPFVFTLELPGRGHGFQLPKSYIKEVATETFDGLKASAMKIKRMLG